MASLTNQTVASSYEQLLHTDVDGGLSTSLVAIKDGNNSITSALKLARDKVEVLPSGADSTTAFKVSQNDGTAILTINSTTPGATITGTATVSDTATITKTGLNASSETYGVNTFVDINSGSSNSNVYGGYIDVDIESGITLSSGSNNVYGLEVKIDADTNPPNTAYGISQAHGTNIDFSYMSWDLDNSTYRFQVTNAGVVNSEGAMNASQSLDYAEYFESKDGNAIAVGTTVKLDGNKIVACSEGDTPIGVIRPANTSSVIGGAQLFHWVDKFEKDDYGAFVWESFEKVRWTDSDGVEHKYHKDRVPDGITIPDDAVTITPSSKRQKLSSSYNSSKEDSYKSREERDEWHVVGLLGQVQITKGQATASNWIKMNDVSDSVEMWFIK